MAGLGFRRSHVVMLSGIFWASGFAALLYQVVWQRLLTLFGGADVYAATIIVSAFMAGLGFGSLAGGHLADRLRVRGRLLAFAASELAVGLFALVSVWIFYDLLYVGLGPLDLPRSISASAVFLALLWPTFFMGMSLPLLARALTLAPWQAADRVAALYGWNTLGAACGSLTTAWVLVRVVGFSTTITAGAAVSLLCGVAALLLAARPLPDPEATSGAGPGRGPVRSTEGFSLRTWLGLFALSGFIALSLEIVWFRVLGAMLKSNSFTFPTLLACYLVGIGAGAQLTRRRAERASRPAAAFLLLQVSIPAYAALSMGLFLHGAPTLGFLKTIWRYMGEYDPLDLSLALLSVQQLAIGGEVSPEGAGAAVRFAALYGLLPLVLIGPPTLMMGASFPYLQRCAQTDLGVLGRRVGWLQTFNIVGSMLGAGLTGLLLLDWLGSAGTLRVLVLLGSVFALLLGSSQPRWRSPRFLQAGSLIVAALVVSPSNELLWARVHGTLPSQIVMAEDGSGVSVLKRQDLVTTVYAGGLGQGRLPALEIHTALGALPVFVHPKPGEVVAIGLGSSATLFAMGGREETRIMQSLEIVGPQLHTLRLLDRYGMYPALHSVLGDPRIRHTVADGRTFLAKSGQFDVIEADALRPTSAYAGNLYSLEYFELLRRSLKPGGLGVSWQPTARTRGTFLHAFPHVLAFGPILIGSSEPIAFDRDTVERRLRAPFSTEYFRRAGIDLFDVLSDYLRGGPIVYGPETPRGAADDINSDLFPRDEYLHSQSFLAGRLR